MDSSLFSYRLTVDDGSAPHIDRRGNYLTLAICMVRMRPQVMKDDWVLGTGGSELSKRCGADVRDRVIYIGKVSEKLEYDEYHREPRFVDRVDRIYYRASNGQWVQHRNPYHKLRDKAKDTRAPYVLICKKFAYFATRGPKVPKEYIGLVHRYQNYKRFPFDDLPMQGLIKYLRESYGDDWNKYRSPSHDPPEQGGHIQC